MSAGKYDFTIEQGANFSKTFTWKTSAGVAININGYTIRMMAREDYENAPPTISLSTVATPGGITIIGDGSTGQFTLAMTPTVTALLDFSTLLYDIEMVSGAGAVTRLLEGTITLSKEITR
jgi:hypothetical protein